MRSRGHLVIALATGCAATFVGASGPAGALAPTTAAWWSVTNVGAAAAPAPPDVKSDDLFVQGSNAVAPGTAPGVLNPPSVQAIAALSFTLPAGATAGPLRLLLDPASTAPPAVSLVACRVTRTFHAVHNGPFAEAPGYDPASCVPGSLTADGTGIVFAKVADLVRDATLALALLPGPLDRAVLLPPSSAALTVLPAVRTVAPPVRPSAGPPAPRPVAPVPVAPAPVAPLLPALGFAPAPSPAPAQPVLAPVIAPLAAARVVAAPVVRAAATTLLPGSGRGRLLAGLGMVALALFSLVGATRGLADGRRTNEHDRGVGRYRASRTGKAPRLS